MGVGVPLRLKQGVRIGGLRPEVVVALIVVEGIFREEQKDAIITSMTDGVHSRRSLHYSGAAFDCRIRHIPDSQDKWEWITKRIQDALGVDFQVILERMGPHIHIEYQPITGGR